MTPIPQERTTREVAPVPPVVQGALPAAGSPTGGSGGAPTPKVPAGKEPATMTAPNAAEQEPAEEAAKELPKRAPKPRGRALTPVPAEPAEAAPEAAPETAPEAAAPAPEPKPKWPPIGPQLDREFTHLAGPAQDVFAGLMAFNGMAAEFEAAIAEDDRKALDAIAERREQADRAHEAVRAHTRYVEQDVCAYAAAVGEARCPVDGTPRGAIYVEGTRTLAEVAAAPARQHHEPATRPWLDAYAVLKSDEHEPETCGEKHCPEHGHTLGYHEDQGPDYEIREHLECQVGGCRYDTWESVAPADD